MKISNHDIAILIFKILCGIVTLFMVGYWVHKFTKNEDVSQVEYISVKAMEEVIHPEITICIFNPFLVQNVTENENTEDYLEYLTGKRDNDDKYEGIRLFDVTMNIFDYVKYPVYLRNRDNTLDQTSCGDERNCLSMEMRNSFNGFIRGMFSKCFSIGISPKFAKNVGEIYFYFDPLLRGKLEDMQNNGFGRIIILFPNYRNQVSKYVNKYQMIWMPNSKDSMNIGIVMASTEILRRRNKWDDPCLKSWRNFDHVQLDEHVNRVGCSNPYLNSSKPICSSAAKMRESMYDIDLVRDQSKPCEEMSNVEIQCLDIGVNGTDDPLLMMGYLGLRIEYPSDIKMITQAPSVDLHSLIGNIGIHRPKL